MKHNRLYGQLLTCNSQTSGPNHCIFPGADISNIRDFEDSFEGTLTRDCESSRAAKKSLAFRKAIVLQTISPVFVLHLFFSHQ